MTALAVFAMAALLSASLRAMTARVWAAPSLQRCNYRDRAVPTGAGTIAVVVVVLIAGMAAVWADEALADDMTVVALAVTGFGMLGLLDDLAGDDDAKGIRNHLRALARGRMTTGALKLFGGLAVAALSLGFAGRAGFAEVVVVAGGANAGNLFDRAPGRSTKLAVMALGALASIGAPVASVAAAVGAGAGLLRAEMAERLMLGDAGANALGAAVGLGVVFAAEGRVALGIAAAIAVFVNVAAEFVSFSRIIDATPPLRWLDRLGRTA